MDALDLVERDLFGQAIIELRGAGGHAPRDPCRDLEVAAVSQVLGDPGAAEAVGADLGGEARLSGAALSWRAFAEEPLILLASLEEESDDPEWLLESRPFIRFNRRAWLGRQIDEWLQANKLNIREGRELDTLESISSMVFFQLGVSIVPRRCVPSARPLPLKRIPLGPSARPRILGVVARKDGSKFQLLEVLLAELVELVKSAGEVKAVHG